MSCILQNCPLMQHAHDYRWFPTVSACDPLKQSSASFASVSWLLPIQPNSIIFGGFFFVLYERFLEVKLSSNSQQKRLMKKSEKQPLFSSAEMFILSII